MNKVKTCFNKMLFFQNIKQFWPIMVLYPATMIVMILSRLKIFSDTYPASYSTISAINSVLSELSMSFLFSLLTAGILFRYLFSKKGSDSIHAMPYSKTNLYVSNLVSGLFLLLIPQLITILLTPALFKMTSIMESVDIKALLSLQLLFLPCTIFFFVLAVFCIMLTGNIVAYPLFFIFLNLFSNGVELFIRSILNSTLFGISFTGTNGVLSIFSPYPKLMNSLSDHLLYETKKVSSVISSSKTNTATPFWILVILYSVVAILLLVISLRLYYARKNERTGDMLVFRPLITVTKVCITIYAAVYIAYIICKAFKTSLYFSQENIRTLLLVLMVSTLVISLLCELILHKKLRISLRGVMSSLILTGILSIALLLVRFDAFGIEKKVPSADDISKVTLDFIQAEDAITISDKEGIAEFLSIHKNILAEKKSIMTACNKLAGTTGYIPNMSTSYVSSITTEDTFGSNPFDNMMAYDYLAQSGDSGMYSTDTFYDNKNGFIYSLKINYYYKNGKKEKRNYYIPVFPTLFSDSDRFDTRLAKVLSNPEYILNSLREYVKHGYTPTNINYNSSSDALAYLASNQNKEDVYSVLDSQVAPNYVQTETKEDAALLFEGVKKDMQEGTMKLHRFLDYDKLSDNPGVTTIQFKAPKNKVDITYFLYSAHDCKNLFDAIRESGLVDKLIAKNSGTLENRPIKDLVAEAAKNIAEKNNLHVAGYYNHRAVEKYNYSAIESICKESGYPDINKSGISNSELYSYKLIDVHVNDNAEVYLNILFNTDKIYAAYLEIPNAVRPIFAVSDSENLIKAQ